jgi:hypothetical protein
MPLLSAAPFTSLTNGTSSIPVCSTAVSLTVACVDIDIVVLKTFASFDSALPCSALLLWLQLRSKRSRRRSIIKGQSERTTTTWTAQTTSLVVLSSRHSPTVPVSQQYYVHAAGLAQESLSLNLRNEIECQWAQ